MRVAIIEDIVEAFDGMEYQDDIKKAYKIVDGIRDADLGIEDLLFKKLYGCYLEYKKGNIGEYEIIDIYDDVVLCDKDRKKYDLNVSGLFEDIKKMTTIGYYRYDDFHTNDGFFPTVEQMENKEEGIALEDYIEINTEELNYLVSRCISRDYILMDTFSKVLQGFVVDKYTPEEVRDYIEDEDKLNYFDGMSGDEVYSIFNNDAFREEYCKDEMTCDAKSDAFVEYLISSNEIDKITKDFIEIRNQCFEAYYILSKIKDGKAADLGLDEEQVDYYRDTYERTKLMYNMDLVKEYEKLSLNDFKLNKNGRLCIINNENIYDKFGVDVDLYSEYAQEEEMER